MTVSARTAKLLHGAERRRLIEAEGRERKRLDHREVSEGVDERVSLGTARGEAFDVPKATGRAEPVRRLTGLEFLARAGKISEAQERVGLAYGEVFRTAAAEASPKSCLNDSVGGGGEPSISAIQAGANRRMVAQYRLEGMRQTLRNQRALVEACDLICGGEMTPREVGGNGLGSGVITATLAIALDLLAMAAVEPAAMRRAA